MLYGIPFPASGANLNGSGGGGSGYCYCERTKMYYPSGCLLDDSHLLLEIPTIEPNNTGNGYILLYLLRLYHLILK